MQEKQQVCGDERADKADSDGPRTLGILTPGFGKTAHATLWVRGTQEGQELLVIPRLRIEQEPALALVAGAGLPDVFANARAVTDDWELEAEVIGGTWELWRTSLPDMTGVGFVLGTRHFNIERAVRGVKRLLT